MMSVAGLRGDRTYRGIQAWDDLPAEIQTCARAVAHALAKRTVIVGSYLHGYWRLGESDLDLAVVDYDPATDRPKVDCVQALHGIKLDLRRGDRLVEAARLPWIEVPT
jgi:hypothetical protein